MQHHIPRYRKVWAIATVCLLLLVVGASAMLVQAQTVRTYNFAGLTDGNHVINIPAQSQVTASASGEPTCAADTLLIVTAPGGNVVATADDNAAGCTGFDSAVGFTAVVAGNYTFTVTDSGGSNFDDPYTLQITVVSPLVIDESAIEQAPTAIVPTPLPPNVLLNWEGNPGSANYDGRLNPSPAEYYTLYCNYDLLRVWRADGQLLNDIPLRNLISIPADGTQVDVGAGMRIARSPDNSDIFALIGSNGSTSGSGVKEFTLSECLERNGTLSLPAEDTSTSANGVGGLPIPSAPERLFADSFNDNGANWFLTPDDNTGASLSGGQLILAANAGWFRWATVSDFSVPTNTFFLQAQLSVPTINSALPGFVVGNEASESFYLFLVGEDGATPDPEWFVKIYQWSGDAFSELETFSLGTTPLWSANQVVTLSLVANSGTYSLYLGNSLLYTTSLTSLGSQVGVAFYATTRSTNTSLSARFDGFVVSQFTAAAPATSSTTSGSTGPAPTPLVP